MLAVFCLRLALGMLAALALLSPRLMHPRFFRTQFLTVLGLCIVALLTGWLTSAEDGLLQNGDHPWTLPYRRAALIAAASLALIGTLVWIYERPPLGWTVLAACVIAQLAALVFTDFGQAVLQVELSGEGNAGLVNTSAGFLVNDLTSAALLGFAVTAMLVGHSYLISPGLTIRPLMGQIAGLGLALLARGAVAGAALWFWTGDHDITNVNDETVLWLPVRWLVGLAGPLIFGWMAYRTACIRSTQSATGILYVVVILAFLGELTSLLLARNTGLPL